MHVLVFVLEFVLVFVLVFVFVFVFVSVFVNYWVNTLFDTCCRFGEDCMKNEWSSSTTNCEIFLLELKTKNTK